MHSAEVGQAVIWVLDNCSRNDRRDTAGEYGEWMCWSMLILGRVEEGTG
jgi:hypothetical protein